MKKKLSLIIVIAIILLMAFTNPTKAEYVDWASNKLNEAVGEDNTLASIGIELFGNSVISSTTNKKSLLIGSLFTTTYEEQEVKVIGIFGNFIPISNSFDSL